MLHNSLKNKRILVVAAHPDDEILGCGGTMARFSEEGAEIHILILGEGITARQRKRTRGKVLRHLSSLKRDSQTAGKVVGARSVVSEQLPDNRFDSVDLLSVVKKIEKQKEKIKPHAILTHHYGDLNNDHVITCRAALIAARPVVAETVKEIYSFEVPSSTEWSGSALGSFFRPSIFVGLDESHIRKKVEAMECYESESRKAPHPRAPESLRALSAWRGSTIGVSHAEAFELLRAIC